MNSSVEVIGYVTPVQCWTATLTFCCFLHAALKRKGKGDDVTEDDMGAVVHAHNSKSLVWSHTALMHAKHM